MKHGRWRISALAALAVLATSSTGLDFAPAQTIVAPPPSTAGTAPRIPPEVFAADPLSADQLNTLRAFAQLWTPQIMGEGGATEDQVVSARFELLQPLSFPGVSNDFRTQYSRITAQHLQGALATERPLLNRLNAMIVVSKLDASDPMLELVMQGLRDESPAVRYWAVMGLGGRSGASVSPQQLNTVLQQLEQMLQQEDALWVLRQVFRVLVELPGPRGLNLVVQALNQRVGAHVGQPTLPYDAEWSGMDAALRRIIRQQAEGADVQEAMRQLACAAAQYLQVIAQQGQANPDKITGQLAESYLRLAALSHQVLTQAQQQFGGNPLPPIPANQLNWTQLGAAAEAARNLLTNPPFNFPPEEVTPRRP